MPLNTQLQLLSFKLLNLFKVTKMFFNIIIISLTYPFFNSFVFKWQPLRKKLV